MKHTRYVCAITMFLIFFLYAWLAFAGVDQRDASMKVSEMVITSRIIHGGPLDSVHRISSSSAKTLYCFTRVLSPDEERRAITHIWYYEDEVEGEYTLPVKGSHWRTYSKKVIPEGMNGSWRVEAVDDQGNVLAAVKFIMN